MQTTRPETAAATAAFAPLPAKPVLLYPFATPPAPGETLEVAPGVLWVRMTLPLALDHINLYLLEDHDGWWVVDTGMRGRSTQASWETIFTSPALHGKPIKAVICTHCHPDHIGQAGWLSERWRAPLWMSAAEYYMGRVFCASSSDGPIWEAHDFYAKAGAPPEFLERIGKGSAGFSGMVEPMPRSFRRLVHGDHLLINGKRWEAVVGRGHSPEHLCLFQPEIGILLSGDQVIPLITSNVSVMAIEPEADPLADWLDSHRRFLRDLPDEVLVLPSHNTPFRGLHARLRYLIEHHEHHLLALEAACVEPRTAVELLPVIFRRALGREQWGLAIGELIAHLHHLRALGLLHREDSEDGLHRYVAADPLRAACLRDGLGPDDEHALMDLAGQHV